MEFAALKEHLNPGSKVLAGQDFWHTTQGETKTVTDFIEHTFQIAFGSAQRQEKLFCTERCGSGGAQMSLVP